MTNAFKSVENKLQSGSSVQQTPQHIIFNASPQMMSQVTVDKEEFKAKTELSSPRATASLDDSQISAS